MIFVVLIKILFLIWVLKRVLSYTECVQQKGLYGPIYIDANSPLSTIPLKNVIINTGYISDEFYTKVIPNQKK